MRLFAGCPIPLDQAAIIAEWAREHFADANIRFVPPEKMHVTLFFFGSLSEEEAAEVAQLTRYVDWKPMQVTAKDIALFSQSALVLRMVAPEGQYRWLTEEIRNKGTSLGCMSEISKELEQRRGKRANHPLQLHVTLGRLKGRARLSLPNSTPSVKFELGEFVLYESAATKEGSVYREIARAGS